MIMRPVSPKGTQPIWANRFLTYVQLFDIQSNGAIDPITHMHTLKCSMRTRDVAMGDVLYISAKQEVTVQCWTVLDSYS